MSGDDGDMEKYKWCCDEIIPSSIKILTEFNLGEAQETRKCKSTHENNVRCCIYYETICLIILNSEARSWMILNRHNQYQL